MLHPMIPLSTLKPSNILDASGISDWYMTIKSSSRAALPGTISSLRLCNELQSDVIANMEQYQAAMDHGGQNSGEKSGRHFGYVAELSYLHHRRHALDALIQAVEKYQIVSDGGGWNGRDAK